MSEDDLQLMRKTCEADMYVAESSHGTDHIRLGRAEEIPWMFMFLSKEQDIDDMVESSEASLMHDPERPIPKEWRLNYQRGIILVFIFKETRTENSWQCQGQRPLDHANQ